MALDIQKIYEMCPSRSKTSSCEEMINLDRLREKLFQLKNTNEDLTKILLERQQHENNDITPPRTMHK